MEFKLPKMNLCGNKKCKTSILLKLLKILIETIG